MTKDKLLRLIEDYTWDFHFYGGTPGKEAEECVSESYRKVVEGIDSLLEKNILSSFYDFME